MTTLSKTHDSVANEKSEFSVNNQRQYNRSTALQWILSHLSEHWTFLTLTITMSIISYVMFSYAHVLYGEGAELILGRGSLDQVVQLSFKVFVVLLVNGIAALIGALSLEVLANRLERDSRHELYISLLGKSQTFHDQQRVGDVMARATDDVRQLNFTISPGILFLGDMSLGFIVPMLFIGSRSLQATGSLELLIVPVLFLVSYILLSRRYMKTLNPVIMQQRMAYGKLTAGLEETISGIEIVKVAAQEGFERKKFFNNAKAYRDFFVQQGQIESRYLPLLVFGIAFGLMFLHTLTLYERGVFGIGDIIAVMGLMSILRFPVFISLFSLSLVELGLASARRILALILQESDIDENVDGHSATIAGAVRFENVTFAYNGGEAILKDISFDVKAGETIAIVGQTGTGKTTLTQLVSRTYDAQQGRVLVDGVDVRDWNLDSLRSQISKIEQDVFLFSRTLAENIAFGTPDATQEQIEQAAKDAQAHDFILSFNEGYDTKIGERGVTLSGGQRQRIALARAFLKNPRILILDDSTSAIDSATEDEIQKAMKKAQMGRTTLLITHRLSQIRWADNILVLEAGHVVASGKHEDLLQTSSHYRRIFARYDVELPPILSAEATGD